MTKTTSDEIQWPYLTFRASSIKYTV